MIPRALFVVLIAFFACVLPAQDPPAEDTPAARAEKLLERVAKRPDRAWDAAVTLRRMAQGEDQPALMALFERKLDDEDEWTRLVCCRLLLPLGSRDACIETLADLLKSENSEVVETVGQLATQHEIEDEEFIGKLKDAWQDNDALSGTARVSLCEALYDLTDDALYLDGLRELAGGTDHDTVGRAAVALAERGEDTETRGRIEQIKGEPGQLGRVARITTQITGIKRAIDEFKGKATERREPLVAGMIRALKTHFADEKFDYNNTRLDLTIDNLVDNACRALVSSVDDFSEYITAEELRRMEEDQSGRYPGIGCFVGKNLDEDYIRVTQPIYEGPAFKAGVRTGDQIIGVLDGEGKRVDLKGAEVEDAVKYIKAPEGTTATIFVKRRGVEGELKFEIVRKIIEVDTALEEMLPGNIGYIRLTRFGGNSADDMARALNNLHSQGMQALVLDLRDNPGGQLDEVLKIADMFLPKNAVISSLGGVYGQWKGRKPPFRSSGPGREETDFTTLPMTCLINDGSASGSEMLSGALKDNKRAVVIGRPSFGKGIGQSFFSINRTRTLKVTVFTYYLPSGTCIDRKGGVGGVTPNIDVDSNYLDGWEVYAREALLKGGKLEEYLDQYYRGENMPKLFKLALFDATDFTRYPEFERFYKSLNTPLSREDVRRELRFKLRTRSQDDRGAEYVQNFQDDPQLKRAIQEVMLKMKRDIASIPEYKAVIK